MTIRNDNVSIDDLIKLIFELYEKIDSFDPELLNKKCMELSNNNRKLSLTGNWKMATAYGSTVIPSMENRKFVWQIKNVGSKINSINIGIDNAEAIWTTDSFLRDTDSRSIHMDGGHSNKCGGRPGPGWKSEGDVLVMRLELEENAKCGKLVMSVNDEKEMVVCDNVIRREGLSYRLAVFLHHEASAVELVSD